MKTQYRKDKIQKAIGIVYEYNVWSICCHSLDDDGSGGNGGYGTAE